MAFSEETIKGAWSRSGGRCECRMRGHVHTFSRCNKPLVLANRGKTVYGGWEAHHKAADAGDDLANCLILCSECFAAAF